MEKISKKAFGEMIEQDEGLRAKMMEIRGESDEKQIEKATAIAASLGYELDLTDEIQELSTEELGQVAGGLPDAKKVVICKKKGHDYIFIRREKGLFWGYNAYYVCQRCGAQRKEWE